MAVGSIDGLDEHLLNELVARGSLDFDAWTTLISSVEQMYHDDIDKISLVYDSFLSEFPLCHGYWKKYAEHTTHLCSVERVVRIFERAVEAVPYSVGVWVDYCSFGISSFEDPLDACRLFERGLSFVGRDYLCYNLWDKFIEFEYSHEHWNSLASIYIQTLKFPTKKLHHYYESFKKLVAIWKENMQYQGGSRKEKQPEHDMIIEVVASEDAEISDVINDLLEPSTRTKALQKYISVGEQFYQRACDLDAKVHKFEQNIHRPYFHVKSLDDNQLHNWHQYLDLVEVEGDFDWAVKLYEKCLISCAHYPEFWMRYVNYAESKGGREIATDALERATLIFLKNVPEIHLFNAWFKEKIGDVNGAQAAFLQCDHEFESYSTDAIRRKANMERRMGNYATSSSIYKEAIELAADKSPETLPMLYVHFARLQYMELILFALLHDGAREVELLDSLMARALALETDGSGGLSNKDQEDISILYLEFVDSCGSIHDIIRAWNRHLKNFPHLVRVHSSLKKPAKAGAMWKMVIEGRPDSPSTHSLRSSKEHDKINLIQLPPRDKVVVAENVDKSERAIHEQTQFEDSDGKLIDLELVTSEVTKTFLTEECKANEPGTGLLNQTADDRNSGEAATDPKSHGIQEKQEQDQRSQKEKPDSLEGHSLSPPDGGSKPAGGHDIDKIRSVSSPVSRGDNFAAETCGESLFPSTMTRKDLSSTLSADHPSDKEGNPRRFNSSGKVRSRLGSPGNSGERLERSLSPRRRIHGCTDDRRHRERSLSPRRHNSRWNSEDRWHRDKRHRRYSRYQDSSQGQKDGRIQHQHIVIIGNKRQTQTAQQQSTGSTSQTQTQLPVQSVAYPQALTNQYPLPINEQYGNAQNNQLYNQMWQYYYYNQQQQQQQQHVLQQPPLGPQQQLQQMQPPQQLQQQMQNPAQQQHMQIPQQPSLHQQQLLHLQYQQQQLFPQLQQQQTNEQTQSQQQQLQQIQQQQVYLQQQQQQQPQPQPQPQPQQQQQQQQGHIQEQQQTQPQQPEEVYLQQQMQQPQESYQYQQVQQQQYLLYLQQLHQYQQSQKQPGLAPDQKSLHEQQKLPQDQQQELPEQQHRDEKSQLKQNYGSAEVSSNNSPQEQGQGSELTHGSTSAAPSQDELPEIEGTDI
ncbi:pre-mRNA-processing factor 39-2 isoform X4 [Beta vulgaris subsp. vulgaris]|uniref:pre-mRNA-processing factor 39-2 isoform X4 n=1 Tax=Beta vulgaris subsp. vulgaris TaxID=3555 RepID=UPI0005401743|nr:pre-mRNA-processing factor 39-2 isoform X4 [Beta vulgaris subsp. vulgaris]